MGVFPELRVPFGDPQNEEYRILGLYWGTAILGNYHIERSWETIRVYSSMENIKATT